ncbi:hypothetical protein ACTTAI_00340 (plasmid) [Rhodobacter capsulatus]|uniref:hypothetical protein n=1 Tax=Rhodobacter capsulatus TaxID=1061 RepID=UPI00402655DD
MTMTEDTLRTADGALGRRSGPDLCRAADVTDPAYLRLGLPVTASTLAVLRSAARALHSDTRAVRGFRAARKRFYRQMLCAHAARQAAGDQRTG